MSRRLSVLEKTSRNSFGFNKSSFNLQNVEQIQQCVNITVLSMELLVLARPELYPNPNIDPIAVIFFGAKIGGRGDLIDDNSIAVINETNTDRSSRLFGRCVASEYDLITEFVAVVKRLDPDFLIGYDIQRHSWGYLIQRAKVVGIDLCQLLSRCPTDKSSKCDTADYWWSLSEVRLCGRVVLNLWRMMRKEAALMSYTFENVAFHLLHERVPLYSFETLTKLFHAPLQRHRVVNYYRYRCRCVIEILVRCDILNRTAEMARLYGIQFYEVLTRGTQFRVESMLLRLARSKNFIAVSPSEDQRRRMDAPECIALTMEPESKFYTDPVVVLDFQSLYPSICIAYNYCYSTCLGKVTRFSYPQMQLGCIELSPPSPSSLRRRLQRGDVHISPAGVAFFTRRIRRGLLPVMLQEILDTRLLVKRSMKRHGCDKELLRVLDARQLALKMIANVTYGYTSANISGRMPCVEVADSIVHKGRETLERAIRLVHQRTDWDARVVYGDTDSMFILLKGRSKSEAFHLGAEIADAVTKDNPVPVKLKFEKVYYPCVLMAKKRYVGYSYESVDQVEPKFDAKGIETVRRDTCPLVAKTMEKSLHLFFSTMGDIDSVASYVTRQMRKVAADRLPLKEFIFAKQYRGADNYRAGAIVPSLVIARLRARRDARAEPRMKERVPYVIVAGDPHATLISCVREPRQLIADTSLRLNSAYYINGQLSAVLNRVFRLVGHDVRNWYSASAADSRVRPLLYGGGRTATLTRYFPVNVCVCCGRSNDGGLCALCESDSDGVTVTMFDRLRGFERALSAVTRICTGCQSLVAPEPLACQSLDCPLYFRHFALSRDAVAFHEAFLQLNL